MSRNRLEHLADEAAGRPVGHSNDSAGPAHAREFCSYQLRTRRKHSTKHARHGIELAIFIRQGFGVAFFKSYVQAFSGSAGAGPLKPVGCNVADREGTSL